MDLYEETRDLKEMMIQWNSLRVTEAYRCVTFTAQQNEALARWREHDPTTTRMSISSSIAWRALRPRWLR